MCLIKRGGDSSNYEFYLVDRQTIAVLMNGFWIRVVPIICVHIRSGSSSLKLMELFIWVMVMLATSLGWILFG